MVINQEPSVENARFGKVETIDADVALAPPTVNRVERQANLRQALDFNSCCRV